MGKEQFISVRMPSSLLVELRSLTVKNHFMDVSEEIRSIIREEWLAFNNPAFQELDLLRNQVQRGEKH